MEWEKRVSYPAPIKLKNMLNTLESLIGFPDITDRYSAMADFISLARKEGIITGSEYHSLRAEIADIL